MRVRITKLPLEKAAFGKQVDGSLSLKPGAFGGADYTARDKTFYKGTKETIGAVPREEANLEAEGGETAFGPISGQSIPDHLKIRGKRHSEGGVPLNLPDDTFIFSDTASLKINDPSVLAMFNKAPKKGGYTPAELAKPYNINKYKSILLDPDTGKLERDTATIMIKNFIMKLGSLALVQESMKGFPQGIPAMAKPYMEANGIQEEDLMPELKAQADALAQQQPGVNPQMPQEQNPMMAQEMQQMAPQQAMQADQAMMQQGEPGYPQQMPSGAPVASPDMMEQMAGQGAMPPPEMMQDPNMMAYGGIPYAMYGMEMGGYDFPYQPDQMAYGGFLQRAQTGVSITPYEGGRTSAGTTTPTGRSNKYSTRDQDIRDYLSQWEGVIPGITEMTEGQAQAAIYDWNLTNNPDAIKSMWKEFGLTNKGLNTPSLNRMATSGVLDDAVLNDPEKLKLLKDAYVDNYFGARQIDPRKTAAPVEPTPLDPFVDSEVVDPAVSDETYTETETLTCKCTDPATGEVTEYPIQSEEECVCQDGTAGQISMAPGMMQTPHWSVPAKTNIMRNALMQVNPAAENVVLPGRSQVQGAYEEYQTKVDQALAANAQMQNAIMNGAAGSTGAKQAQMKDLLGKSIRASMDAVAGVQSRNVDRQRETNVQTATIDNTNALARAQALQMGLSAQKDRKDARTANVNKRRFNTLGAVMDADREMATRQQMNVTTPQYASEYDYGFITPTGVEKPFNGATGATLEDRIQYYLAKTGDYATAFDMAYKEARLSSKYGGQKMNGGGYVLANNAFPFIL